MGHQANQAPFVPDTSSHLFRSSWPHVPSLLSPRCYTSATASCVHSAGLTWPHAPITNPLPVTDFLGHCGVGCPGATQHLHLGNPECGKAIPMCIQELELNSSSFPPMQEWYRQDGAHGAYHQQCPLHNASPCIFSPSFFPGLLVSLIPTSPELHSSTKDQYDSTSDSVFWRPGLKYSLWEN